MLESIVDGDTIKNAEQLQRYILSRVVVGIPTY